MKIVGILLTVFGVLMLLSSLNLARTQYNMHDSHDLSKFGGGLAISILILAVGVNTVRKNR